MGRVLKKIETKMAPMWGQASNLYLSGESHKKAVAFIPVDERGEARGGVSVPRAADVLGDDQRELGSAVVATKVLVMPAKNALSMNGCCEVDV